MERPDWDFWLDIGEVEAWQAVLLSLDIEPGSHDIDVTTHLLTPALDKQHERDFKKRTIKLEKRIPFDFKIYGHRPYCGGLFNQIKVADFSGWAIAQSWDIPQHLSEIANPFRHWHDVVLSPATESESSDEPEAEEFLAPDEELAEIVASNQSAPAPKIEIAKPTTSKRKKPEGGDALTPVIWGICYEMFESGTALKDIKPREVMRKLKEMAAMGVSPLTADVGDGVQFENASGELKTVKQPALGKRIKEWRKAEIGG